MGEGDPGTPFGWFGDDQADSSIFNTGSLITKESETKVSEDAPDSAHTALRDAENDDGFDPYNSGRFNTK